MDDLQPAKEVFLTLLVEAWGFLLRLYHQLVSLWAVIHLEYLVHGMPMTRRFKACGPLCDVSLSLSSRSRVAAVRNVQAARIL